MGSQVFPWTLWSHIFKRYHFGATYFGLESEHCREYVEGSILTNTVIKSACHLVIIVWHNPKTPT
jgi:hypothetical protein